MAGSPLDLPIEGAAEPVALGLALLLGAARAAGMAAALPLFSYLGLRGILRAGVAGALALPAVLGLPAELMAARPDTLTLAALGMKEAAVGFVLGLLLGLPFWALEAAGATLDQQRLALGATATMPDGATETTVLGLFLGLVFMAYVIAAGGHLVALELLYRSYAIWPALAFAPPAWPDAGVLVGFLHDLFTLALLIAAPIVGALLLVDVAVALLARFAPQMNALALAVEAKSLLAAVAVALALGAMLSTAVGEGAGFDLARRALDALEAAPRAAE